MLGSAVSSSRPTDFQPRSHMGDGLRPATKRQAEKGVHPGCPYSAVGMQRAVESAIGLPRRSTNESWMLGFWTPPDVRRSFTPGHDSRTLAAFAALEGAGQYAFMKSTGFRLLIGILV